MKEENKKCWSCGRFQRYYTKGLNSLQKQDSGFCPIKGKIVCKDESCKMWNYRQKLRDRRRQTAISSITDIRDKLETIELILTEEREMEKVKNEKSP